MELTKYGHSCLHVVDGSASILIDPGSYSSGFEGLTGLTDVLITHQHGDHVDVDRLRTLLRANPGARVYADVGTAEQGAAEGIEVEAVQEGDVLDLGTTVEVFGQEHAVVHPDIPVVPNVCYLIAGRLFHPGDSLTVPDVPIELLALPVMAPWMAVREAIDYLRAVSPPQWIPIHEAMLAQPAFVYGMLQRLGPSGSAMLDLDDGHTQSV